MERKRNNFSLAIFGGLLTSIIGGAVWALIVILTEYEIGFVAWAIGGLAGYSVFYLAKGNVTSAHKVIAVVGSLIGILLGKYFIVGYYYSNSFSGIFKSEVFILFQDNISVLFSGMDIIFVLLAVITAWQLPDKLSNKATSTDQSAESAAE
ncbi:MULTISPECIES: hypothetical protein [Virgibacillus]|nr:MULTISPECIES: hypothetical protein [Virgibacillus]